MSTRTSGVPTIKRLIGLLFMHDRPSPPILFILSWLPSPPPPSVLKYRFVTQPLFQASPLHPRRDKRIAPRKTDVNIHRRFSSFPRTIRFLPTHSPIFAPCKLNETVANFAFDIYAFIPAPSTSTKVKR